MSPRGKMLLEDKIFAFMNELILKAGEIALENSSARTLTALKPGPQLSQRVVTAGDLAVNKFLCEQISAEYPNFLIFSEENAGWIAKRLNPGNGTPAYRVIIDPIDGSYNYNQGVPTFSITLGIAKVEKDGNRSSIMGFNYLPEEKVFYHARLGKGAFKDGTRIHVSQKKVLADADILDEEGWDNAKFSDEFQRYAHTVRERAPFNTATALCYVAEGKFDGLTFCTISYHDIAGSALILQEAGGQVYLFPRSGDCQENHRYDIVATNGKLDKALLKISGRNEETHHMLPGKY